MTKKIELHPEKYVNFSPPSPVVLVTCSSQDGKHNIITVGMYMPISFNPPLVAIGISPKRYSHKLIKELGEFVVNVPTREIVEKVVYCGTVSGRDVDKFKEAGLTPIPAKMVRPPLIKECIAHFECKLYASYEAGDHTIFVGRVVAVSVNENIEREGVLDSARVGTLSHRGRFYYIPALFYEAK